MKNNFTIIIRHLLRDKSYLLVNMLSLSVGLLCCLFIFKYVQQEWSYDKFHEKAVRISRIGLDVHSDDGTSSQYAYLGTSPVNWLNEIPEIKKQTRFATFNWDMNVDIAGEKFTENGLISADSSFFNLFSFNLLQGNPVTVLKKPNSVVLTKSIAQKYFGSEDILGETVSIGFRDAQARFTVTGIVENIPSNSHFSFDIVTSADAYKILNGISLQNYPNTYCYVETNQNVTTDQLEKKLNALYKQNAPEKASVAQFYVQPMTTIHLHSSTIGELATNSNAVYVYLFVVVAFIILGIACVNFATLATTRSVKRSREMGIRKVFGAEKSSLIVNGLLESVLLSFAGLTLAYLLAWFLLPFFNQLAGKHFSYTEFANLYYLLLMAAATLVVGIISGLYPALVLSQHKTTSLLQKNLLKAPVAICFGKAWL